MGTFFATWEPYHENSEVHKMAANTLPEIQSIIEAFVKGRMSKFGRWRVNYGERMHPAEMVCIYEINNRMEVECIMRGDFVENDTVIWTEYA